MDEQGPLNEDFKQQSVQEGNSLPWKQMEAWPVGAGMEPLMPTNAELPWMELSRDGQGSQKDLLEYFVSTRKTTKGEKTKRPNLKTAEIQKLLR